MERDGEGWRGMEREQLKKNSGRSVVKQVEL
jgi:hypothetical protein